MSELHMTIHLNGKAQEIRQTCSVLNLLAELGWRPTQVVLEHNGQVIPRSQLESVQLKEGDHVEIILPVAGG
jgi:thiamine biosynthesis protein ThiS